MVNSVLKKCEPKGKKLSRLSLVKVNPEIWKLKKQFKLKSKFEITKNIQ